jgi:hypothetical protein
MKETSFSDMSFEDLAKFEGEYGTSLGSTTGLLELGKKRAAKYGIGKRHRVWGIRLLPRSKAQPEGRKR